MAVSEPVDIADISSCIARKWAPLGTDKHDDLAQAIALGILESGATKPEIVWTVGKRSAVEYWRQVHLVKRGGPGRKGSGREWVKTVSVAEVSEPAPDIAAMIDMDRAGVIKPRRSGERYEAESPENLAEIARRLAASGPLFLWTWTTDWQPHLRIVGPSGLTLRSWM